MRENNIPYAGLLKDLPVKAARAVNSGAEKRIVFGPGRFFDDYVVRSFTLPSGEAVPTNSHDWPHYIITLCGHGEAVIGGQTCDLPAQSWAHVPEGVSHSYRNRGAESWTFLCIVPWRGDPHGRRTRYRMMKRDS